VGHVSNVPGFTRFPPRNLPGPSILARWKRAPRVFQRSPEGEGTSAAESCRVVHYDPLRVEIEAELTRPGLVVLADQFYPGWRLSVATAGGPDRQVPILRTNRVMRGAWLPAGRHRLVYRYRPASFLWGAAISGIGWIGLATAVLVGRYGRRRRGEC
jgi:hypothetical protein